MVRQTSIDSFMSLTKTLSSRQQLIYEYFKDYLVPATDMEICRANNISDTNFLRPRRHELFKLGLLREGEKRHCTVTGRLAMTWVLV